MVRESGASKSKFLGSSHKKAQEAQEKTGVRPPPAKRALQLRMNSRFAKRV
jgi:hypothetical protein